MLCKESNHIIKYKGELSKKLPKKQLHISKSGRKGKAVEYNTKGGNRIRVIVLTVNIKVKT